MTLYTRKFKNIYFILHFCCIDYTSNLWPSKMLQWPLTFWRTRDKQVSSKRSCRIKQHWLRTLLLSNYLNKFISLSNMLKISRLRMFWIFGKNGPVKNEIENILEKFENIVTLFFDSSQLLKEETHPHLTLITCNRLKIFILHKNQHS